MSSISSISSLSSLSCISSISKSSKASKTANFLKKKCKFLQLREQNLYKIFNKESKTPIRDSQESAHIFG